MTLEQLVSSLTVGALILGILAKGRYKHIPLCIIDYCFEILWNRLASLMCRVYRVKLYEF